MDNFELTLKQYHTGAQIKLTVQATNCVDASSLAEMLADRMPTDSVFLNDSDKETECVWFGESKKI